MKPTDEKTLLHYWLILYRYKKTVAFITLVSLITAVVISLTLKPVYEAYAMFYVPSTSPSQSYLSPNSSDKLARDAKVPYTKEEPQAPYIGMLKSKNITGSVYEEFPHKSIMKYYLFDIDFELTDEFMIKVYSRDSDPKKAAAIANAYVSHLNDLLQASSEYNLNNDVSLMDRSASDTKSRLSKAQEVLKEFETKNNFASVDEEIKNLTTQKVSFQTQLETNRAQIEEADEKIKAISDQLAKEKDIHAQDGLTLSSPLVERLQQQLSDITIQISTANLEIREAHPDMIALKKKYSETETQLDKELKRLVKSQIQPGNSFAEQLRQNMGNSLIEKSRLVALNKGYAEVVNRLTERLNRLPWLKMQWTRLNDETERYRKMYEQIKINSREAGIQKDRQMQFVVLVDRALPPDRPSFPIMWLNILVSLFFGLGAGILYAFFMYYVEVSRKYRMSKLIKAIVSQED